MAVSRYPNGFSGGLEVRGVPVTMSHPGKVIWVSNSSVLMDGQAQAGSDSSAGDGTRARPYSTLTYALTKAVASRGDVIVLAPGHAETKATTGAIDINVAGVAVVGLGRGSLRPTFNLTHTGAHLAVSAANVLVHNVLVTGGVDAITKAVSVSAADVTLSDCEIRDVTGEMVLGVLTTAAANRLKILGHTHDGAATAGTGAAIALVGGDGIEITAKKIKGDFSVGGIDVRTTATTNLHVHDVEMFQTLNSADIFLVDTITASTGQVGPNINIMLKDNAANITEACTGATFRYMQPINVVNLAGESSLQINITASADA